jgi:metallo-beta-lactamase family protein
LGAQLASGHKQVNIFGEPHRVRAKVETINAFSGHADCHELRAWAERLTGSLQGVFIVHGEIEAATAFGQTLQQLHPAARMLIPEFKDSVEL